MSFTKLRLQHRRDTRAAQPAATSVVQGTLYYATDENVLERSSGSAWESFGPGPLLGVKPQADTSTGTAAGFVPTASVVRLNNATALTINGIAPGYDGQEVEFQSVGAAEVYFNHQNGGATGATYRLINWITAGPTPIFGGVARFRYDGTTQRWRLVHHAQGDYISIPFASCTFDSNLGAFWTVDSGDVVSMRYMVKNREVLLHLSFATTTTLTGVGSRIRVDFSSLLPWVWLVTTRNWCRVTDGGAAQDGMVTCAASTTGLVQWSSSSADTAWGVGANNRTIDGCTVVGMLT